jgi:hypothetical protein
VVGAPTGLDRQMTVRRQPSGCWLGEDWVAGAHRGDKRFVTSTRLGRPSCVFLTELRWAGATAPSRCGRDGAGVPIT